MRAATRAFVALLIGLAGGFVFDLLGAPLPWTLGSLAAAALVAVAGAPWLMPNAIRNVARPVVGLLAGSAFTPAVVASIGEWWTAILYVAAYSFVVSALGWVFFRKLCRLDPVTAFFASTPGGLGELTLLGGSLGGSMRTLVTIHSVRVVTVVFTMPILVYTLGAAELAPMQGLSPAVVDARPDPTMVDWLIVAACGVGGYVLATFTALPGGVMIITMLLSAVVHATGLAHAAPPPWMMVLVQVVIGAVVGARFAGIAWGEFRQTVLRAFTWAALVIATAVLAARMGAVLFDRPFSALLLSMAPGGMAEIIFISFALGIETAFVVTCQVCRSGFVLMFAPLFAQAFKVAPRKGAGAND